MIVYKPADYVLNQSELHLFAIEAAKKAFPGIKFLLSRLGTQRVSFPLLDASGLIAFEFHQRSLQAEDWNYISRDISEFKTRHGKSTGPSLDHVNLCIMAHGFSKCFLEQVQVSKFQIRLFTWILIHSEDHPALLIQEFNERETTKGMSEDNRFSNESPSIVTGHTASCPELSTAELIELTRLGIEIRARR